jgi:hypothetical protein
MEHSLKSADHVPVADVEITAVTPDRTGFTLEGRGADRADYRLRLDLEVPVDQKTRSILGELLSQSKWRLWRRAIAGRPGGAMTAGRSKDAETAAG